MGSIFEKMIGDLSSIDPGQQMQDSMSFDPKKIKRLPLRYRIIALGFVKHLSPEEVNSKLLEAGCEALYARNFWEASLIYAFARGLDYEKWKALMEGLREQNISLEENPYFQERNLLFSELESYISSNSEKNTGELVTEHRTRMIEGDLKGLTGGEAAFYAYMRANLREFSGVREKTRYYFCKYLYYYLNRKMENYLQAEKNGFSREEMYSELTVFKGISELGRKQMSEQEARDLLRGAALSCGGIYDAFNQYYFDYTSADWMEVMIDYYGDIRQIPEKDREELVRSLRAYNKEWAGLSDEEVLAEKCRELEEREALLDQVYSLDGSSKGYQQNRSGEKSVRNYIRGGLDIDRTTLICYLLFFGSAAEPPAGQEITEQRLNDILEECHMPRLRPSEPFDTFVRGYLQAEDSVDYLMDTITSYAFAQKNSFLYHMYHESISNSSQLQKIMGV